MKHIICYSGGHSSAIAAIEVARRFGTSDLVLLNHDMAAHVEDADIKRFKLEVSKYIGTEITFCNYLDASQDQFDVTVAASAFKVGDGQELCTNRLKTGPFTKYLKDNFSDFDCVIYYGFDANEQKRITRRVGILAALGYRSDYPLIWSIRTISAIEEIGILRPQTYSKFKHGNCIGCLKAGWQHWYIVFCTRPDIWNKAKWAEDDIGYAIHHGDNGPEYLSDMEDKFKAMQLAGIPQTEHIPQQRFWAQANKIVKINAWQDSIPCECAS